MNQLIIDAGNSRKIKVELYIKDKKYSVDSKRNHFASCDSLTLVEKVLKKSNRKIFDIEKILVQTDPNSFVGTRNVLTIVKILNWLLAVKYDIKNR